MNLADDINIPVFLNKFPLPVCVLDENFKFLYVNSEWSRYGYIQEELSGKHLKDLIDITEDDIESIITGKRKVLASKDLPLPSRNIVQSHWNIKQDKDNSIFFCIVDIEKSTDYSLNYTGKVFEAITKVAELLSNKNYSESKNQVLELVGKAVNVNRSYIFEFSETRRSTCTQTAEWTDGTVSSELDNENLIELDLKRNLPRWWNTLQEDEKIAGLVKDFPQEEKEILIPQSIISLLVEPIFVDNMLWGFVGFDDCDKEREWQKHELEALHTLKILLGSAVKLEEMRSRQQDFN